MHCSVGSDPITPVEGREFIVGYGLWRYSGIGLIDCENCGKRGKRWKKMYDEAGLNGGTLILASPFGIEHSRVGGLPHQTQGW